MPSAFKASLGDCHGATPVRSIAVPYTGNTLASAGVFNYVAFYMDGRAAAVADAKHQETGSMTRGPDASVFVVLIDSHLIGRACDRSD